MVNARQDADRGSVPTLRQDRDADDAALDARLDYSSDGSEALGEALLERLGLAKRSKD